MTSNSDSAIALGHLRLPVTRLSDAVEFFEALGARADVRQDEFAVVELRDRTRLQLVQSKEKIAAKSALQFDFLVEDIDAAWRDYDAKGLKPSEILRHRIHDSFILSGPDSCEVKVNSRYKG